MLLYSHSGNFKSSFRRNTFPLPFQFTDRINNSYRKRRPQSLLLYFSHPYEILNHYLLFHFYSRGRIRTFHPSCFLNVLYRTHKISPSLPAAKKYMHDRLFCNRQTLSKILSSHLKTLLLFHYLYLHLVNFY